MWHRPQLLNAIADLLMLVGGGLVLAAVGVWLVRYPALPVREVVFIETLAHTQRAEIEAVLPKVLGGNFFSVSLEDVRGVIERLPWVRKAEVRRVWPARLEVRVEEHKALARWGEARGELVNSYGEVFTAAPTTAEAASLPLLYGPPGTAPEVLKRFGELVGDFMRIGEKPVQLTLSPRLAWQLKLANGMVVDVGREEEKSRISARLQRFIEVYPERIAKRMPRPSVVDLRYPNGFAMRFAPEGKGK